MKAPSPLVGFNNNVKHKGRVFHIQTEDSGIKHPHIITHLFADGGRILKTTKTSYAEHIGAVAMTETVRAMMQEQHKAMFIALRDGQFDQIIDEAGGTRNPTTPSSGSAGKPAQSFGGARIGPAPKPEPSPPPSTGQGLAELRAALKPTSTPAAGTSGAAMTGEPSPPSKPRNAMSALLAESSPSSRPRSAVGSTPEPFPAAKPRAPLGSSPEVSPPSNPTPSMGSASGEPPSTKPAIDEAPPPKSKRTASRPRVPINPAQLLSARSPTSQTRPRDWAPAAAATASSSGGIDLDLDALERAASDAQTPFFKRVEDLPPPPAAVLGSSRAGATASAAGAYRTISAPLAGPGNEAPAPAPRGEVKTPSVPAAARYAPSRPASIFANNRPTEGMSIFGGEEISEKSLDEVILSYLAEDLDSTLPPKK